MKPNECVHLFIAKTPEKAAHNTTEVRFYEMTALVIRFTEMALKIEHGMVRRSYTAILFSM